LVGEWRARSDWIGRAGPHSRHGPAYELLGATSTTPSRIVAGQEAQTLLGSALAELPPDYAKVVRLHDLEGRTGPEVAAAMGRSRGAIFMLLARAHDQLRQSLGSATKFFSQGT